MSAHSFSLRRWAFLLVSAYFLSHLDVALGYRERGVRRRRRTKEQHQQVLLHSNDGGGSHSIHTREYPKQLRVTEASPRQGMISHFSTDTLQEEEDSYERELWGFLESRKKEDKKKDEESNILGAEGDELTEEPTDPPKDAKESRDEETEEPTDPPKDEKEDSQSSVDDEDDEDEEEESTSVLLPPNVTMGTNETLPLELPNEGDQEEEDGMVEEEIEVDEDEDEEDDGSKSKDEATEEPSDEMVSETIPPTLAPTLEPAIAEDMVVSSAQDAAAADEAKCDKKKCKDVTESAVAAEEQEEEEEEDEEDVEEEEEEEEAQEQEEEDDGDDEDEEVDEVEESTTEESSLNMTSNVNLTIAPTEFVPTEDEGEEVEVEGEEEAVDDETDPPTIPLEDDYFTVSTQTRDPMVELVEPTQCIELKDAYIYMYNFQLNEANCMEDPNRCTGGCCRLSDHVFCDESNERSDLPCICNINTAVEVAVARNGGGSR